ncbi:M24 family metallopeptidase [Thermogladius sp.]|uniref:M24 family metallopeptidase n=1 Tax=Thermogladius sp. TaxID=2023064 RepID=UPI003D098755
MLWKVEEIAERRGLDAVVIVSPENVEYFTGVKSLADGVVLLFYDRRRRSTQVYTPLLDYYRYRDSLEASGVEVYGLSKTLKPSDARVVDKDWAELVKSLAGGGKVGLDARFTSPLMGVVMRSLGEYVDVSDDISKYRMVKEDWEIELIKRAVDVTIQGIRAVVDAVDVGVSEAELAGVFEGTVRKMGVEDYAFPLIVSTSPNNSYPHNTPTTAKVKQGDLIVIDVGVRVGGRCSDLTRVVKVGSIPGEFKRLVDVVVEAVSESIDSVQPGVKAGEVAERAIAVMERHGLKERFIHGLGHGIGVVVHEPPYLRVGHETVLEKNMVFTIEPGVYIPGVVGVRIEEDVLVDERGARVLSSSLSRVFEV